MDVTNLKRILVVEDNPDYLAQVKGMFAKRDSSKLKLEVTYAANLSETMSLIANNKYEGIMSDVFLPDADGLEEKLNGYKVGQQAFEKETPVVLVTSTYHHDGKTEPASRWAREHGFDLIDTDGSYAGKNFIGALLALGYIIEAKAAEIVGISSSGYKPGMKQTNFMQTPTYGAINFANNMDYDIKNGQLAAELKTACERNPLLQKAVETYCAGLLPN